MATDSAARQAPRLLALFAGPVEGKIRAAVLGGAATALTLAGSFLKFLNHNQYPLASGEALLVIAGILVASIVVGLCCGALGGFARVLLPGLLTYLAIDMHFTTSWLPLFGFFAAGILHRFSRQALIFLFGVVVVSEVSSAALGGRSADDEPVRATSVMPAKADFAIVHLVLDEHIGLEGIPDSAPGGAEVREELRRFYVDHGFRVFGGAYSESLRTMHAMPRALGLDNASGWMTRGMSGTTLDQNPYFDILQSMGFRIDVTQSDWVKYCEHAAVEKCTTHVAGAVTDVGDKLPTVDKAAVLVYRFAALSRFGRNMFQFYDDVALAARRRGFDVQPVELMWRPLPSALSGMAAFEEVIEAARSLSPGRAIFAHILLPHFPFVYDRGCETRRVSDWVGQISVVSWEKRYAAYFDQVICTTRKVEALLAAVAASPAAGKTVFIIHGDHGSRIMRVYVNLENDGKFSARDLVDGHAAFFAVAAPGIAPRYDSGRYPLRLLLGTLVRSQFRALDPALPAGFVPTILLEDSSWRPITERPLVDIDWWNTPPEGPAASD